MQFTYWLVLREPDIAHGKISRNLVPSFVHGSRKSAEMEAERLAIATGDWFCVLETVAIISAPTKEINGELRKVPVYQEIEGSQQ